LTLYDTLGHVSTDATSAIRRPAAAGGSHAAAAPAPSARSRSVPGEPGAWIFILGDLTVFAVLFVVFVHNRGLRPALYARSQLELHRSFGAINTLVLLTSSLAVVIGVRAIRAHMQRLARLAIAVALACGCVFLAHHRTPAGNNFFMYFFVLTGLHAFHVVIGMCVLVAVFVLARKPQLSEGQKAFIEGGTCFWHMVDQLWVVLFALLYLVR